jgi:hypothetical protein
MPFQCRRCVTEIIWLKHATTNKPAPIEAAPHPDGNLVISREKGLYRQATDEEKETARVEGKNLYINHFATCEFAKKFAKKERAKQ